MPRVSEAGREALPEALGPLYEAFTSGSSDFKSQADILAHSPPAFRHLYELIDEWRSTGSLSRRVIEVAVVTTSQVNACGYCVAHHGAVLMLEGLSAEAVERILDPEPPGFDRVDLVVRDYARYMTERAWGIPDRMFERLRAEFDERQIVELTVRIGICGLFNKFNQALQIELEPGLVADKLVP